MKALPITVYADSPDEFIIIRRYLSLLEPKIKIKKLGFIDDFLSCSHRYKGYVGIAYKGKITSSKNQQHCIQINKGIDKLCKLE